MSNNTIPRGPMGANIPSHAELQRYSVNRHNEPEAYRQSLYDFQTYANAGSTQFTFFQNPVGQGGRTSADTNMEQAGALPSPKAMLVQSIEVVLFPGVNPVTENNTTTAAAVESNFTNDVYALQKAGYLDFFIGSKSYLIEAPLGRFPPKTRLHTQFGFGVQIAQASAADQTAQVSGDYACFDGRPYMVNPWILLTSTQNFKVTLNFPTAVSLPSGQDARIGVILDGISYRLSQ